eukprot:scaffold17867_cov146-Skeletonema_marinoi.AAC.1
MQHQSPPSVLHDPREKATTSFFSDSLRQNRETKDGKKGGCSDGCTNYACTGGVCIRHGAKMKRCSSEGCTNGAVIGGVCIRHGAKSQPKTCTSEGCSNIIVQGGLC